MNNFVEIPATKFSLSMRKPLYGVGINDAQYFVRPPANKRSRVCPYYLAWANMITRSYSSKLQKIKPTYKGCSVVKEWLTFSIFRQWMELQDWEGKQLDKDLLVLGNKVYGPDTCIFVSGDINKLLLSCDAARGKYPQGVSFHIRVGKYISSCRFDGRNNHLGHFLTIKEAECAYLAFKSNLVRGIANEKESSENPKLKKALLGHAIKLEEKLKYTLDSNDLKR